MIVPVRCFSCGAVIGDKYEEFRRRVEENEDPKQVLDELGVVRYCCRRMLLSHRDFIDDVIKLEEKGP
ncbi:MAG: DNA-directed RNA polymerase subunit N [Euryarchaeota archaeon]|nr:DNA-directed RNA polymerase subunit N [Euryarchaeota archaeon]